MASAVEKFVNSLHGNVTDKAILAQIMHGYENISDQSKKEQKARFFISAMQAMDESLDYETRYVIRDACACCKGGWREKAMLKIAKCYKNESLQEKLLALGQVEHMGKPYLNEEGHIIAGIGGPAGCNCACSIFSGAGGKQPEEPVSSTYCLCCAGHFRYHYQIALGKKLRTKAILSSALESCGTAPCRFLYEIAEE